MIFNFVTCCRIPLVEVACNDTCSPEQTADLTAKVTDIIESLCENSTWGLNSRSDKVDLPCVRKAKLHEVIPHELTAPASIGHVMTRYGDLFIFSKNSANTSVKRLAVDTKHHGLSFTSVESNAEEIAQLGSCATVTHRFQLWT